MSLVFYLLCFFWLAVHFGSWTWNRKKKENVLPYYRNGLRRTSNIRFHLRFLHLRIETSGWNEIHDRLVTRLKRKDQRIKKWLERLYSLGYIFAFVGMGAAIGLLVWTSWVFLRSLSSQNIQIVSSTIGDFMKRDSVMAEGLLEDAPRSPITPILPGVTVPMNHLPLIFMALFINQVLHEMGHAVAGALYGIPILSSGVSLTLCIPAAFVSFSTAALDTLRPSTRSRVIAAGPFHNLLLWCLLFLAGHSGLSVLWNIVGYRDISSLGIVILSVDDDSPMSGYLIPGTIVTKLNDQELVPSPLNPDPWTAFLNSGVEEDIYQGWCVDLKAIETSTRACCLPDERTLNSSLACFAANTIPNLIGCLDPIPIMTNTDEKARCSTEGDCATGDICIRPAKKEGLLRLTIKENTEDRPKILLWSGPRQEIWEEVMTGRWLPRLNILPLSLPAWVGFFWEYLVMINTSLYLFNLLPVPGLDGFHFLQTLLPVMVRDEAHQLDASQYQV